MCQAIISILTVFKVGAGEIGSRCEQVSKVQSIRKSRRHSPAKHNLVIGDIPLAMPQTPAFIESSRDHLFPPSSQIGTPEKHALDTIGTEFSNQF